MQIFKSKALHILAAYLAISLVFGGCSSTKKPKPSEGVQRTRTPSAERSCKLGVNLNIHNSEMLRKYVDMRGVISTWSFELAQRNFSGYDGWFRVLIAPSLADLEDMAKKAKENNIPYEALGYDLEEGANVPSSEYNDPLGSGEAARALADKYRKQLVMLPALSLMTKNSDLYSPMAALSDAWMIQTQDLQVLPPEEYRHQVEQIIQLIRSGHADLPVYAQIVLTPQRLEAQYWLDYRQAIANRVQGVALAFFAWDKVDHQQALMVMEQVMTTVCSNATPVP